ncbi:DinB family protein [Nocardioides salarius]|uniref:DinB family protein n=1 Tax=Nocardioides salarius TaxID=374513 RepID=UPI0030F4F45F
MPFLAPPAATEQDNLTGYLSMQLDAFRALAHGLSDEQAAANPSASAFSIGGLVRHVTLVTANWVDAATHAPEPTPPGQVERRIAEFERGFVVGDSLAAAMKEYDDVCDRALEAARTVDLDTSVPVPDAPWFPKDVAHWSVRWVWGHLVQELARHAGHGDIIRETLDGATMYELVAAAEGMGDLGFLRPWTPPEPGITTGVGRAARP